RDRHHAVGGLMVLVEADAVEAELVGELHLIEVFVIEAGALLRIIMPVRERDPGRAVALDGVEVGVPIRHQVKVEEFHAGTLAPSRKISRAATNSCGRSTCGKCPQSGITTSLAPGISR